ncbi:MAG: glycosyl hydrolase [Actinomycetota bacterium]
MTCLALVSDDSAAKKRKPPPLYWGAWIGWQLTGTEAPYDMNAVSKFQSLVGKGLSLVEWSQAFSDCRSSPCQFFDFPAADLQNVRQYGAIPVLSWASSSIPNYVNQPDFQLSDVIAGRYDGHIRSWASAARAWGHPFFLRFNWEMNGDWFPWGEATNGNQPGQSVAAWRHVHDIFTSVGATNATWVWCPLAEIKKNTVRGLRAVYPGDGYVDWTCLDGYNWGTTPENPHPWRSFNKIFRKDYLSITTKIARKKPMMLGEIGSHSGGGNKTAWIRAMFRKVRTDYRKVRALIWFNAFDRTINWPVETSPSTLAAFRRGVGKPNYKPNIYGNISARPIPRPRR